MRDKLKRFVDVLPVIAFFIVLFWCVTLLFGAQYTIAVSCYTALFNTRFRKYNSPARYLHILLLSTALLVLARLAVANLPLCIFLNLTVPLVLVFMRSSQLNPRRYFPYTMLFVFLELRPENFDNPPTQLLVVLTCAGVTVAGLALCGLVRREQDRSVAMLHRSIRRLAAVLERMADRGVDKHTRSELIAIKNEFSAFAYAAREDSSAPDGISNLFDMFAALAHRTAYLAGNLDWKRSLDASEKHAGEGGPEASAVSAYSRCMHDLAQLTCAVDIAINREDNGALIARAEELLASYEFEEERLRIFLRGYLLMLILVLKDAQDPRHRRWQPSVANQLRIAAFRKRPSLDSFELRLSIRCGIVVATACALNMIFPVDHFYWLTLHAFVLVQPYRDESHRRMRTRAVGTVLGCVLAHGLALLNLPYAGVMALGMAFTAGLYTSRPGSVSMAFFATAYAVSLASFSIGDRYATVMRIACLVLAIALVFTVNRLVCPTNDRLLFQSNMRLLFNIYERYWKLVRRSLTKDVEAAVPVEALLHFQMVHLQAISYVDELEEGERKQAARRVLFHMWELACEMEQLELLVRLGEVPDGEVSALEEFAQVAEAHVNPFAHDEDMRALDAVAARISMEDVRYVLEQYLLQSERLAAALEDAPCVTFDKPGYLDEVRAK